MKGTLCISLDPTYIAFLAQDSIDGCQHYSSHAEIRELLLDLEAITPFHKWPLRDGTMRIAGEFAIGHLAKYGLLPLSAVEEIVEEIVEETIKRLPTAV